MLAHMFAEQEFILREVFLKFKYIKHKFTPI